MTTQNATNSATQFPGSMKTNESDAGHNHDDVIFADELYYVIGGVTIVCIVAAVVVAVILWKKAHPCRKSSWDIERNSRTCMAVRFKNIERKHEPPDMDPNHALNKRRAEREDFHPPVPPTIEIHPAGENSCPTGFETEAVVSAPDIITAHDSESMFETVDEKQTKPGQVMAGKNTPHDNGGKGQRKRNSADAATATSSATVHPSTPKSRPPPTPPKPRTTRGPDGSIRVMDAKNRPGIQTTRNDSDAREQRLLLSSADSLRTALGKVALENCPSGASLVCQVKVVGLAEKGKSTFMEKPSADGGMLFLLDPSTGRERGELVQPSVIPASQGQVQGEALKGGRDYSVGELRRGHTVNISSQRQYPQKTLTMPNSRSLRAGGFQSSRSGREEAETAVMYRPGRRLSLQNHPPDCPRHALRRLSENTNASALHAYRNSGMKTSLPTLPSTKDTSLSPRKPEYRRSLSSPPPAQDNPSTPEREPTDRRLDAESLKARIQREMRALGFLDEVSTEDPEARKESTHNQERLRLGVQNEASPCSVGRPSQNEYFILEPQSDSSDDDSSVSDWCPGSSAGHAPTPHPVIEPSSRSPTVAVPGENLRFHRNLTVTGLPPRIPPQKPPRGAGHTRSRSETPGFQIDNVQRGMDHREEKKKEEEEQGPVIVSLKKFRTMDREGRGRGVPMPTGSARESPRRPAFRPRIHSEPDCS